MNQVSIICAYVGITDIVEMYYSVIFNKKNVNEVLKWIDKGIHSLKKNAFMHPKHDHL